MHDACGMPEFAAFANHLAFLARHRGEMEADGAGTWIRGEGPGLTTWTPAPGTAPPAPACPAVRLGPWTQPEWAPWLAQHGYAEAERLSYMELGTSGKSGDTSGTLSIGIARSAADALAFAEVQAAGFATGAHHIDDWWAGHFRTVALRNRLDPLQSFYLGRCGEQAACTTLVLRAAGVAGIYAVATRPDYRRRGFARALLERACADAASSGLARVILQAMEGSYAQDYYARLGFTCSGTLAVWRT